MFEKAIRCRLRLWVPITLTIHPRRDGSNGGEFLTATPPDGRQMDGTVPSLFKLVCNRCAIKPHAAAEFWQSRLRSLILRDALQH
jgi:hypothetical protein